MTSTHNPYFLKVLHLMRLKVALFQLVNLHKTFHKNKEAWNQSIHDNTQNIQTHKFINLHYLFQAQQHLVGQHFDTL